MMKKNFFRLMGIACGLSFGFLDIVHAQSTGGMQTQENQSIKLVYDIYNKGMHVITVNANYSLTPTTYKVKANFASAGMASLVFSLNTNATVDGVFKNGHALPGTYQSIGKDKNGKFKLVMNSNYGSKTDITTLEPAPGNDRDVLTPDQKTNSLDVLSAMADLIYKVRTTGKCDSQFKLSDGLRSFSFQSETAGESEMPSTWTSPYKGKAILCKAVAQQIGGFKTHSHNRALLSQPQPGSIWFKNIDGIGYLPARFDFKNPKMGVVTGVLRQIPVGE
ncbi:unnamed protein product [Commensalibacter communis]|uniref:DUF3108 domain-containing protein n=1 Tax=Commensalibacter communis TaxID=2972786 RepID=A0A9W4XCP9_9PROT|nr:DUF3108 domain-containing protein [Commensalibacter communis]CAI3928430.1 unnamed protein product [Commensalibacter communis]CAI3929022.1 unnamed protein product [Commensalibacter communis]CAI3932434.1 unnamed protein product [Commensalibacter communis]CAI3933799.1 unnamed protein product [Commensalibacter communis]CAI3933970.1 unnamed protein product [Commensalibacter communis]